MAKLSDDEFRSVIDQQVTQAASWSQSVMAGDRERNLRYYHGLPMGNEVDGRSQVVSWDIFEVVETAMPSLLEPFFSGDEIGEFEPSKPEDEGYCEQATDYVNYLIKKKNPGFITFNTWIKDGLLSKVGVVRSWWDATRVTKREEYTGLTEEQLVLLMDNPDIEILSQSAQPDPDDERQRNQAMQQMASLPPEQAAQVQQMLSQPPKMLYDVEIQVDCGPKGVCIENVPPEMFILTRRAKTLGEVDIIGEQKHYTRSQLVEMGFKKDRVWALSDYDFSEIEGGLIDERDMDRLWGANDDTAEESLREIALFFGFVRCDYNGDGVAEWRRVLLAGNDILENDEVDDGHEYHLWSPILLPHRIIGMAMADPLVSIQEESTALTRQYLDALYLANNPATYAVDGKVNLDDLLSRKIGRVVRIKEIGAVGPLQTTMPANESLQGLELIAAKREQRIGVTRYNQGLDAESLNQTATGVAKIMGAAERRMLMVLRIFAETGVKSLFKHVLKLICTYQDKPATVRLRNEWVDYDPRNWSHEMDVNINVGLGTGDKQETMAFLMGMGAYFQQAAPLGIVRPENVYELGKMLLKAGKIQGGETKLLTDPAKAAPKEPQKSPEQVIAEAEMQMEQLRQQGKMTELQAKSQFDAQKLEAETTLKQLDLMLKEKEIRIKEIELGIKDRDSQFNQQRQQYEMQRGDEQKQQGEAQSAQANQLAQMIAELQAVMRRATAPKRIVRDPATNRAVGVETIEDEEQ